MKNDITLQNSVDNRDIKKISIFGYIAMLFMLFLTDSGIVTYGSNTMYYLSMLSCLAIAGYAILTLINKRFYTRTAIVFTLIIIWIGMYSIVIGSGVGQTLRYVSLLVIGLYISYIVPLDKFMKAFTDVCFVLALIAIFMWLIVFLFPDVYDVLPIIELKSNHSSSNEMFEYRTLFLANMHKSDYTLIDRVYSIFWEPGVCQAYFNIALIYTTRFIRGKRQIIYSIVFIVAVILTLSTGGYLALACVIGLILFSGGGFKNYGGIVLRILLFVGIIFLVVSFTAFQDSDLFTSVFGKLSDGTDHQSVASRFNSIEGNLLILRDNFFIGVGLNQSSTALEKYNIFTNQTNTILDYFATFGFIIGSIYTICWGYYINNLGKNIIQKLLILGAFVCVFFNEDFIGSIHFYILMMYGARFCFDRKREPLQEGCL